MIILLYNLFVIKIINKVKMQNKYQKITKRKNLKWYVVSLLSIPLIVTSVSVPIIVLNSMNRKLDYLNIFSTYDNAQDNLAALGYAPDYDTTSNGGRTKYSSYLEGYVNNDITKYVDIRIMDGQGVDRKAIDNLQIDTIVLNEWEKGDAYKFDGILNNIAYTSMGDSVSARYTTSMTTGGFTWKEQVSINNALMMLAQDLDKIYSLNNKLENRANDIINADLERTKFINENNKNAIDNLNFGILKSSAVDSTEINTKFSFYSPYEYPMLYSDDPTKGIGLNFPEPKSQDFINSTHGYKETGYIIKGESSPQLLDQFGGKFDYLVFSGRDITLMDNKITFNDVLKSDIPKLLKDPSKAKDRILFTNDGQWYQSAWGIIGKRIILDEVVKFLNIKDIEQSKKWEAYPGDKLIRLRYLNKG